VQNYLYDTSQKTLLATAIIAMGWPIFLVTSSVIYVAIRSGDPGIAPRSRLHGGIGGRWIHAAENPGEPVKTVFQLVARVIIRVGIHVVTSRVAGGSC
jgi:hypothetical protein